MARMLVAVAGVAVAACGGPQSGVTASIPFQAKASFASQIKHIKLRAIDSEALFLNAPEQLAQYARNSSDYPIPSTNQHHPTALNTAVRVLESKGYLVTVVWDDPHSYGSDRPCIGPKPGDPQPTMEEIQAGRIPRPAWLQECIRARGEGHRGFYFEMAHYDGTLADDEAFIELTTVSHVATSTTTQTYSTETETGRITDASGDTIGRVYTTGEETSTKVHTRKYSSASVQIFISSQRESVYDGQAWTEKTANLVYPTEDVLAAIPPRAR
jgi:hypothetical protein